MSEPLGHDRLGRLVYEGDVVDCNIPVRVIAGKEYRNITGTCDYIRVNIALSPPRSNYERYFADFGSLGDVFSLAFDACGFTSDYDCDQSRCPFDEWTDCDELCIAAFYEWLKQEAVA